MRLPRSPAPAPRARLFAFFFSLSLSHLFNFIIIISLLFLVVLFSYLVYSVVCTHTAHIYIYTCHQKIFICNERKHNKNKRPPRATPACGESARTEDGAGFNRSCRALRACLTIDHRPRICPLRLSCHPVLPRTLTARARPKGATAPSRAHATAPSPPSPPPALPPSHSHPAS